MIECMRIKTAAGDVRRLERDDEDYPAQLRAVPSAPDALYVRGTLVPDDALAVAIVGARAATAYGLGVAEDFAGALAARGVTVVSGLARGIDSAAHRGALAAGGRTIAVLGSGLDRIYPPENRRLAAQVEEQGAVLSQFAPGMPAFSHHFPLRNLVIAGLALAVVVVEAAEKSGALITARLAGELGREVMAVPGRVTSLASRGAHALIRDGAALVERWEDVVAALPARWRACVRVTTPDRTTGGVPLGDGGAIDEQAADEAIVLGAVADEPVTMDEVIERSGLGSGRAAALVLALELDGRIRQIEGRRFVQVAPAGATRGED
jgi:DNA processing protein